jgi:hypothetical protein
MPRELALVVFVLMLLPSAASAQHDTEISVRPTVAFGFSFAVVGLDTYGIAADVRAGADIVFDRSHELTLTAGWTPSTATGARLDVFALDAGWRWRPAPEVGFFTRATLGAALAREALDVTLGNRHFGDVLVAPGVVGSVAVGWTLFDYVDVEIGYRQAFLVLEGEVLPLGSVVGSIGGRL